MSDDPTTGRGRLDAIYERASTECRPVSVMWEVTYDCNLRCRHCYVEREEERPLALDEALRVLDDLARSGVLFVAFTGGEPFARNDFLDIARAAVEREFAVRVLTNGTLVGDAEADGLAGVGPTSVDISIYGRQAAHDRVTGSPGSHAAARAAVDRLVARGVPVRIKTPLMKANRGEFAAVRELAASVEAEMVFDTTMVCRQSGDRAPLEEQLPDEEIAALLAGLAAGRPFPPGGNLRPGEPFCSAGRSAARLTPSGRVTPCVALPGAAGSVRETSFADIWRSEAFEPLRRLRLEDLPRCRDCELRDWCVRCPGLALVDDGDVTGPSAAACRLARICAALSQHAAGTSPLRRGAPRAAGEEATADERP